MDVSEDFISNGARNTKDSWRLWLLFSWSNRSEICSNLSEVLLMLFLDRRSENWYLAESPPLTISLILLGYVVMIKKGPKLMENQPAFDLKNVMMIYNLFQVVANLGLGVYVSRKNQPSGIINFNQISIYFKGTHFFFIANRFDFRCQDVNFSSDEYGIMETRFTYLYFLLKVLDLFDTVIWLVKLLWKRYRLWLFDFTLTHSNNHMEMQIVDCHDIIC